MFWKICLASICLLSLSTAQAQQSYPRWELHEDDWTHEVPREEVYKYQMVSGGAATHLVMAWKDTVPDKHKAWLKSTLFVQQSCPLTARWDWCQREHYPVWIEAHWHENPDYAVEYAVYRNYKAGRIQFLLDSKGQPFSVWGPHCMLDMTEHCPKGVWGPTEGKTVAEYMSSDAWLDIFTESDWSEAYDVWQCEDGPPWGGAACWLWGDRLIRCGGKLMNCRDYRDQIAWPAMNLWLKECIKVLGQRGVIVRANGHFSPHTPGIQWPEIGEAFTACELEGFGAWGHAPGFGAWPAWDVLGWTKVYLDLGEFYERPDLSSCQIRDHGHEHQKEMAALVLQGDAFMHIVRADDPDGIHKKWEPIDLPRELEINLGKPLGPGQSATDSEGWTIYWRYFKRGRLVRTVAFNPHPMIVLGLKPGGTWSLGKWLPKPRGIYDGCLGRALEDKRPDVSCPGLPRNHGR